MTFCVSTGVGTWTNRSTFEPNSDHSPDAGTGLLSHTAYALQRGILLRRENPTYSYWAPVEAATSCVVLTRRNTVVGGKCALPSALLVISYFHNNKNIYKQQQYNNYNLFIYT